jgi:hypothetical protein
MERQVFSSSGCQRSVLPRSVILNPTVIPNRTFPPIRPCG